MKLNLGGPSTTLATCTPGLLLSSADVDAPANVLLARLVTALPRN